MLEQELVQSVTVKRTKQLRTRRKGKAEEDTAERKVEGDNSDDSTFVVNVVGFDAIAFTCKAYS